jgi:sterol desaturase/sphingolipid hydroxylase (fatty acid hydroxylase superfamily)
MLWLIFSAFAGCFILERIFPGWPLPRVRSWPLRVLLVNAIQLIVVVLAGLSWERWLSSWSVFRLSDHVSPAIGGLFAYFIATFTFYWWHRWRHESDLLWRLFHQIHHSPQRLEVITSFYKHPGEMVFNSILGSLLVYTLLGLSLQAGAIYTARIRLPAARDASHSSSARSPQEQLWRHHLVGHAVRHLRKSKGLDLHLWF